MTKYAIILHPDAEADINSSYQWGRKVWGDKQAKAWVRELQRTIRSRLTSTPLSCPLAPESDDLGIAIRQLVLQRYRVLFMVKKKRPQFFTSEVHTLLVLIYAKRVTNNTGVFQSLHLSMKGLSRSVTRLEIPSLISNAGLLSS